MVVRHLCGLLNVFDQVLPGCRKALVSLRLRSAFNQGLNNACRGDFLATTIENLSLQLSDQGIGLVAELDAVTRHRLSDIYLTCST